VDKPNSTRGVHEIVHSKVLSLRDTEKIWGWGTPAGRLRAKRRAEMIIAGAGLSPGKQILEIGCGTGVFTEMFVQAGPHIIAVDISADLLAKAQARDLPADQVIFIEKRFEECQVDGPFDAVIGSSVLHHLEIEVALLKIYELLKPGGYISFTEPNILNPQIFIERKLNFLPLYSYVSPDETAFTRWQLSKLLLKTGFEDIKITPFDWLHPSTPVSLIPVVSAMGQLLEKIPYLCEFAGSLCICGRRPAMS